MARYAWLIVVPVLLVAAYFALLFIVQRSMLFPMPSEVPSRPPQGAEEVRVKFDGGEAYGLYLPPRQPPPGAAPLLMFMHGNGEIVDYWPDEFTAPRAWGSGVLLVEYPGYGRAPGLPSEQSITETMLALYDWAAHRPGIDPKRIVAYGRSLGGGAAVRLAVNRPVAGLILESTFTSVADFAAGYLAPAFLVRDRFDSRTTLAAYRGPLLVIHGVQDALVPVAHGRELATLVPGAKFHELNCGHNDCPRDWKTIGAFLASLGVVKTSSP
jgi:fermentation-respiration switch protein FrsA (DUF1100 family)